MATEKAVFTAGDGSHAALMCIMALVAELGRKGTLTPGESSNVFAMAASMCRGGGNEQAAKLIENIVPSAVGIDPVAVAKSQGATVIIKD